MAKLHVIAGPHQGATFELTTDRITIGRDLDNQIRFPDSLVSRHHAELLREGTGYRLKDLNSTNGSFVNEERIVEQAIKPGDKIRLADVELDLVDEPPNQTQELKPEEILNPPPSAPASDSLAVTQPLKLSPYAVKPPLPPPREKTNSALKIAPPPERGVWRPPKPPEKPLPVRSHPPSVTAPAASPAPAPPPEPVKPAPAAPAVPVAPVATPKPVAQPAPALPENETLKPEAVPTPDAEPPKKGFFGGLLGRRPESKQPPATPAPRPAVPEKPPAAVKPAKQSAAFVPAPATAPTPSQPATPPPTPATSKPENPPVAKTPEAETLKKPTLSKPADIPLSVKPAAAPAPGPAPEAKPAPLKGPPMPRPSMPGVPAAAPRAAAGGIETPRPRPTPTVDAGPGAPLPRPIRQVSAPAPVAAIDPVLEPETPPRWPRVLFLVILVVGVLLLVAGYSVPANVLRFFGLLTIITGLFGVAHNWAPLPPRPKQQA